MDRITREDIKTLLEKRGEFLASLYMPTVRSGDQVDTNPIRLKNLIQQLETELEKLEAHKKDIEKYLEPLWELQANHRFWQFQSDGLAIFNSQDFFGYYRLPIDFENLVILGDHFHTKPMLPVLAEDGDFYLLALSQGSVQLYHCTRWTCEKVELEALPDGIDETLFYDVEQKTIRGREGAGQSSASHYHAQGRADDNDIENIKRYFHQIDDALSDYFNDSRTPLVLACVDYLYPLYNEVNEAAQLMETHVSGNPEHVKPNELHEKAWQVIAPHFHQTRETARDKFHELKGTGKAGDDINDVVRAAYQGRVDTLFVANDERRWGFYFPDSDKVELREQRDTYDEDLLDYAARYTIVNSGAVYSMPADEVPGSGPVAAVYRY